MEVVHTHASCTELRAGSPVWDRAKIRKGNNTTTFLKRTIVKPQSTVLLLKKVSHVTSVYVDVDGCQ